MNTKSENETKMQFVAVCCAPSTGWKAFWGIFLVLLGALGLLSTFMPLQHLGHYLLPAFLLLWGGYLLYAWLRAYSKKDGF